MSDLVFTALSQLPHTLVAAELDRLAHRDLGRFAPPGTWAMLAVLTPPLGGDGSPSPIRTVDACDVARALFLGDVYGNTPVAEISYLLDGRPLRALQVTLVSLLLQAPAEKTQAVMIRNLPSVYTRGELTAAAFAVLSESSWRATAGQLWTALYRCGGTGEDPVVQQLLTPYPNDNILQHVGVYHARLGA